MVTGHVTLKLLDVVRHEQHGQTPTTWLSGTSHFEIWFNFFFCYPFCFDKKTHTHTRDTNTTHREKGWRRLNDFKSSTVWLGSKRLGSNEHVHLPHGLVEHCQKNRERGYSPTRQLTENWTEPNNPQANTHTTYSRRSTTTTNNNNRVCFSSWLFWLLQQNRLFFFFFIRGRVTHCLHKANRERKKKKKPVSSPHLDVRSL
jgi:hypothetical protein